MHVVEIGCEVKHMFLFVCYRYINCHTYLSINNHMINNHQFTSISLVYHLSYQNYRITISVTDSLQCISLYCVVHA